MDGWNRVWISQSVILLYIWWSPSDTINHGDSQTLQICGRVWALNEHVVWKDSEHRNPTLKGYSMASIEHHQLVTALAWSQSPAVHVNQHLLTLRWGAIHLKTHSYLLRSTHELAQMCTGDGPLVDTFTTDAIEIISLTHCPLFSCPVWHPN